MVSLRGQKVADEKIDRYLLGFVMKISENLTLGEPLRDVYVISNKILLILVSYIR